MFERISIKGKVSIILGVSALGLVLVLILSLFSLRAEMMKDRQDKTRSVVETAFSLVARYEELARKGSLTTAQAQEAAKDALRAMRYGADDYFFISDLSPRMIMHPIKPELDGQDLSQNTDPNGKKLFVAFADVARRDGQ